ncbi:hypothetical protein CC2G_011860 [Coprinopsis cinerea AmutBmut pab1-1]|nr:hypothetical protein CC2G_011860 [Coprinopsis cinerea AmutBmut pab1-1]
MHCPRGRPPTMALSAAPVKPKGPLPGLRTLHVLVTGFLSVAIIGISVKASDVLRRNRWTCYRRPDLYPDLDCPLPTIAFARYIPFLAIAAGGVLVCFINLLRHCMFQFRTSSKWILAESVAGLLGWTAVAIATGVENFREGGREEREIGQKCTAHYLYYHQPERGSRGHFVYCVAQDLTWALTCAVALNYLWGLGLWYLTRREEKRRERFTAGVYALNLMYDQGTVHMLRVHVLQVVLAALVLSWKRSILNSRASSRGSSLRRIKSRPRKMFIRSM